MQPWASTRFFPGIHIHYKSKIKLLSNRDVPTEARMGAGFPPKKINELIVGQKSKQYIVNNNG